MQDWLAIILLDFVAIDLIERMLKKDPLEWVIILEINSREKCLLLKANQKYEIQP